VSRRGIGIRALALFERTARVLRRLGLGPLVDRVGPALGGRAARLEVEVDGLTLAGDHVGQLYYLRELADAGREELFKELLVDAVPAGGFAVDGGAHIGYLTLQLARAAGPDGTVLAFEPNPETRPVLEQNLRRNGLAGRVTVCPQALGAAPGEGELHLSGGGDTSALVPVPSARATVRVEITSLDVRLAAGAMPDVVKLDLEGSEVAALTGMEALLARAEDTPRLFVECNADALAAASASPAELLGLLEGHGFGVWRIDERERLLRPALLADLGGDYANLVCARGAAVHAYEALSA
jgi:FkbM family methyltransferase